MPWRTNKISAQDISTTLDTMIFYSLCLLDIFLITYSLPALVCLSSGGGGRWIPGYEDESQDLAEIARIYADAPTCSQEQ